MWHYEITQRRCEDNFEFVLLSPALVWSTPLGLPWRCDGRIHQHSISNIRRRIKIKIKKVTLYMLTHGAMWGCGLTSWVVCINDKFHDIRKRNMTIRSKIWTTNIRSVGFWDIREYVTLWKLGLWSLGCMHTNTHNIYTHTPIWHLICGARELVVPPGQHNKLHAPDFDKSHHIISNSPFQVEGFQS